MLDDVVALAAPLRLVHALQQADKPIDMVFFPQGGHSLSSESVSYAWDYMVKHLMGVVPPREARLSNKAGGE